MSRLTYDTLVSEIKDRLNFYVGRNIISAQERQLYYAPARIARASTEALLKYVQISHGESLPHLLEDLTLTHDRKFNLVKSYQFPEAAFSERSDNGFLTVIIDGVELDWEERVSVQEVEHRAKSIYYDRGFTCFAADQSKRRFYAPDCTEFKVQIIRMPEEVSSANQDKYHGVSLEITAPPNASESMTVSDGTNEVTVALTSSDTASQAADKIIAAINNDDTFYYEAEKSGSDTVILSRLHRGPLNPDLNPSISDGGTNITISVTDIGTQYLPVDKNYLDALAEASMKQLVSLSNPQLEPEPAPQEPQKE